MNENINFSDSDSDSDINIEEYLFLIFVNNILNIGNNNNSVYLINPDKSESLYKFNDVYEISNDSPIGEGSFGIVKKAYNKISKKNVAIKFMKDKLDKETTIPMLMQEINNLKKVFEKCKDFVCIEGWGNYNGNGFIAMEYIIGQDLENFIDNKYILGNTDLIEVYDQLINKLKYIHSLGLAHCDIKPENILLVNKNNSYFIKIIDFGLACDDINFSCDSNSGTKYFMRTYTGESLKSRQKSDWYALTIVFMLLYYIRNPDFSKFENKLNEKMIKKYIQKFETNEPNAVEQFIIYAYNKSL